MFARSGNKSNIHKHSAKIRSLYYYIFFCFVFVANLFFNLTGGNEGVKRSTEKSNNFR